MVNNTGVIEARTVGTSQGGRITLLGRHGGRHGRTSAARWMPRHRPRGNGGFDRDLRGARGSGERRQGHDRGGHGAVRQLADRSGTISPSRRRVAMKPVRSCPPRLAGGNVTIQSSGGNAGTAGNINVDDNVTWAAHALTLVGTKRHQYKYAHERLRHRRALRCCTGQKAVSAGNSSTYSVNAPVNLPAGPNFSTRLGSNGATTSFHRDHGIGPGCGCQPLLPVWQLCRAWRPRQAWAAISCSAPTSMRHRRRDGMAVAGFTPIGTTTVNGNGNITSVTPFTGSFDGLGHTISNLVIYEPNTEGVALFGVAGGLRRPLGMWDWLERALPARNLSAYWWARTPVLCTAATPLAP